jgi:hypothetical protein
VLRDPSVQMIRILQKIVRIVEQTAEECFVTGYSRTWYYTVPLTLPRAMYSTKVTAYFKTCLLNKQYIRQNTVVTKYVLQEMYLYLSTIVLYCVFSSLSGVVNQIAGRRKTERCFKIRVSGNIHQKLN